jgi:Concanavalin A-like lectin/glucanases superfamily/Galactose oxidase-like, Early set domain/Bacterial Ig domain/Glucodextranase, domain B/Kelch motif
MSHQRSYLTLVRWTLVALIFLICPSAVLAGQASGLVAAYAFNEISGTTTADVSGSGNNGTLTNGALFAAGKNGNAVSLDGVNDFVNLANPVSLRITGSMTVSAWINSSSFPFDDAAIVSKRQSTDAGYQLDTTVDTGPRTIGFKISNAGSNVARYGVTSLSLNTWYHVAGVYDATNRTLNVYLNGQLDNGVLVGTIPASQPTSTQNVNIGRRPGIPNTFNFAGKIDDVRIYNRALTQVEIQTDMNTAVGGTPPSDTTGPVVAISSHTNNQTVTSSPITVSGTASDSGLGNSGISSVTVNGVAASGGMAVGSGTANWSQSVTLNSGANTITVVARDNSTNQNSATVQITVNYNPSSPDTTGPTVAITSHTNNQTVTSSPITVSGTASDSGLGNNGISSVTVNGVAASGGTAVGSGTANWSQSITLNSGANTITVVARDNSTNQNSTTGSIVVTYNATQPAGVVAAYAFNETSGTTTFDSSGSGNTGALTNGALFAAGRNGNAVSLDGANDFVNLGNPNSLQLTSSMTISAWINSSSFPVDDGAVVSKRSNTEVGFQLDTTVDRGPRTIGFKLTSSSGALMARYGATALQLNQWYHVAGVYNASTQTIDVYLNGQLNNGTLLGSVTTSQQNSNSNVNIGQRTGFPGTFNFSGKIDDVRIYNRALTQAEIQTDMNTPVTGAPSDTTAPTVAITVPAAGATVFNQVTVSATASDNLGISGVQFFVDGVPLETEAVSAPYEVVWDTTAVTLGNHVLTAVARDFGNNTTTSSPVSVTVVAPTPSLVGQWAAPFNWPIVAVHAYLLPTGEVMASDGQQFAGKNARIWNPTTNAFTTVNIGTGTNVFCAGHCHLPDGRVVVAGGHVLNAHVGVTDTNIFNPMTRQWTRVASMHTPRWYPTTTTLPDGRILVTAGEINCDACNALIPEIYNPITNTWTELLGASLDLSYYPHMFVLPDGRVLAASTTETPIVTQALDINTQTWSVIDPNAVDGGSAAMYLPGKIIKSGTSTNPDDPVVPTEATTYVLDMTEASPAWRQTSSMVFSRTFHTLTVLPDGTVLVTGGGPTTDALGVNSAIKAAELWSPTTEAWTTMASMQNPRLYHSNALLLPDGRVLAVGGGRFDNAAAPTDQLNGEIYSPPYLFKGSRPVISSVPVQIGYGQTITVQTPDASRISTVSLIKLGSVTHQFNMDQRYVPLTFTPGSGSLSVQTPANRNLAPPGHYMVFIVDTNGVPSIAPIVNIQ